MSSEDGKLVAPTTSRKGPVYLTSSGESVAVSTIMLHLATYDSLQECANRLRMRVSDLELFIYSQPDARKLLARKRDVRGISRAARIAEQLPEIEAAYVDLALSAKTKDAVREKALRYLMDTAAPVSPGPVSPGLVPDSRAVSADAAAEEARAEEIAVARQLRSVRAARNAARSARARTVVLHADEDGVLRPHDGHTDGGE